MNRFKTFISAVFLGVLPLAAGNVYDSFNANKAQQDAVEMEPPAEMTANMPKGCGEVKMLMLGQQSKAGAERILRSLPEDDLWMQIENEKVYLMMYGEETGTKETFDIVLYLIADSQPMLFFLKGNENFFETIKFFD